MSSHCNECHVAVHRLSSVPYQHQHALRMLLNVCRRPLHSCCLANCHVEPKSSLQKLKRISGSDSQADAEEAEYHVLFALSFCFIVCKPLTRISTLCAQALKHQ